MHLCIGEYIINFKDVFSCGFCDCGRLSILLIMSRPLHERGEGSRVGAEPCKPHPTALYTHGDFEKYHFWIMAHIEKRKIQFKKKNISGKRAERNEIYNTRTWRNLRDLKLQQSPLCERCLKDGKINNATQVHHIESFMIEGGDRIELAFDINNLQSLCVKCHQLIHNRNERQ